MVVDSFSDGQETAVLCSAGLDSAVLLADEAAHGWVTPVYVSVGLAWEEAERRALDKLLAAPPFAARVRRPQILEFSMRDIYAPTHWAVRGVAPAFDTPDEDVYLVGRNVVLLTKAGILAAQRRLGRVVLGTLAGNPFPDATPAFIASMGDALSRGLAHPLIIETPFRDLHKDAVVARGVALGVPLELSLSCMQPVNDLHCGRCSKCRERRDAFLAAGVHDPTVYATPPVRSELSCVAQLRKDSEHRVGRAPTPACSTQPVEERRSGGPVRRRRARTHAHRRSRFPARAGCRRGQRSRRPRQCVDRLVRRDQWLAPDRSSTSSRRRQSSSRWR